MSDSLAEQAKDDSGAILTDYEVVVGGSFVWSGTSWLVHTGAPLKARWHMVQDAWALVDEADGEVLATVEEQRGIWIMEGDGGGKERYISESAAKKRAEEYAQIDEVVVGTRQNSAGIP